MPAAASAFATAAPELATALVGAGGLAGAAVGAVAPALARWALGGGRRRGLVPPAADPPAADPSAGPGLGRRSAAVAALATGALTAAVVAGTPTPRLPLALLLLAVGPVLVVADLAAHRLPDRATGPAAVAAAALALAAGGPGLLVQALMGGLGAVLVLALLQAATAGGLGSGDVKLAGVIGLVLGQLGAAQVALGLAAGTLLGGLAALALLVVDHRRAPAAIPFGPWLLLGALLVAASPTTIA
ncbi:prepilin signalpeptidase [Clavibacter michiganensis]|nr:prepilin signalpeptidase [Clavibacter michiganensis]